MTLVTNLRWLTVSLALASIAFLNAHQFTAKMSSGCSKAVNAENGYDGIFPQLVEKLPHCSIREHVNMLEWLKNCIIITSWQFHSRWDDSCLIRMTIFFSSRENKWVWDRVISKVTVTPLFRSPWSEIYLMVYFLCMYEFCIQIIFFSLVMIEPAGHRRIDVDFRHTLNFISFFSYARGSLLRITWLDRFHTRISVEDTRYKLFSAPRLREIFTTYYHIFVRYYDSS